MGEVRWTEGFWANRFSLNQTVTLPSMRRAMDDPTNGAVFENLFIAAGLKDGEHVGTNWSDGDCYKWMEAAAHTYEITQEPELDQALDALIAVIAQAQDDDGYICTQTQLNPAKERWGARHYHELYNMGHLMTAAAVHHRVTGKRSFLDMARKLADYLYDLFAPRPTELAHFPWNPSNIMGLIDLYRETGEARYRDLADIFVTMRGSEPWPHNFGEAVGIRDPNPGDQNQDRVPLREEDDAVGHAVTATYLYCGAADVYAETGDPALLAALERIWERVVQRKMYVTGAVGAYHHGVSRRGDKVHEAFGLDYELPNATAYNETCANIGNGMWNQRMLALTGDARYADVMEQVIYNSGLSPIDLAGTHFCYTNPLRWHGGDHDALSHDTPARWETHNCYCCPPQVARTIARMHTWAYSRSGDGLWVHLYGGSQVATEINDAPLALEQTTNYPWDGEITLTLQTTPDAPWTLHLRIPGWLQDAPGATLTVNGAPAGIDLKPGAYAAMTRSWQPGDVVRLTLPLDARMIQAHPKVEATRNQVAVARGPVVYCLESADLPDNVDLNDVHLPYDVELIPRYAPDFLGGVTVLEGKGVLLQTRAHAPNPALYRTLDASKPTPVPLRLIPYYAWNNRGPGKMAVWLPVG